MGSHLCGHIGFLFEQVVNVLAVHYVAFVVNEVACLDIFPQRCVVSERSCSVRSFVSEVVPRPGRYCLGMRHQGHGQPPLSCMVAIRTLYRDVSMQNNFME